MTHTAEIESDAHDLHHHEKEGSFVQESDCSWIPIKLSYGFRFLTVKLLGSPLLSQPSSTLSGLYSTEKSTKRKLNDLE